jgi:hypothetical protein
MPMGVGMGMGPVMSVSVSGGGVSVSGNGNGGELAAAMRMSSNRGYRASQSQRRYAAATAVASRSASQMKRMQLIYGMTPATNNANSNSIGNNSNNKSRARTSHGHRHKHGHQKASSNINNDCTNDNEYDYDNFDDHKTLASITPDPMVHYAATTVAAVMNGNTNATFLSNGHSQIVSNNVRPVYTSMSISMSGLTQDNYPQCVGMTYDSDQHDAGHSNDNTSKAKHVNVNDGDHKDNDQNGYSLVTPRTALRIMTNDPNAQFQSSMYPLTPPPLSLSSTSIKSARPNIAMSPRVISGMSVPSPKPPNIISVVPPRPPPSSLPSPHRPPSSLSYYHLDVNQHHGSQQLYSVATVAPSAVSGVDHRTRALSAVMRRRHHHHIDDNDDNEDDNYNATRKTQSYRPLSSNGHRDEKTGYTTSSSPSVRSSSLKRRIPRASSAGRSHSHARYVTPTPTPTAMVTAGSAGGNNNHGATTVVVCARAGSPRPIYLQNDAASTRDCGANIIGRSATPIPTPPSSSLSLATPTPTPLSSNNVEVSRRGSGGWTSRGRSRSPHPIASSLSSSVSMLPTQSIQRPRSGSATRSINPSSATVSIVPTKERNRRSSSRPSSSTGARQQVANRSAAACHIMDRLPDEVQLSDYSLDQH